MKKFKKELWLQSANEQIEQGIISERERNDAIEIWVNDFDGKTEDELKEMGADINEEWMQEEEVSDEEN
nr:MAG TPA: hypothetical protein [Caudoviricetes sp.]